jgi:hypothetical protein
VEKYAEEEDQGGTSNSLDIQDSRDLISELLGLYRTAVIIIDALDECTGEARVDLLDFIRTTLDTSPCKFTDQPVFLFRSVSRLRGKFS